MTPPAGIATIASTWDDTPQVRGAVAFCKAAATDCETADFATMQYLEIREDDDGATVMRKFRASLAYAKAAAAACRETDEGVNYTPLKAAIDNHAWLAIRGAYRSRDARASGIRMEMFR